MLCRTHWSQGSYLLLRLQLLFLCSGRGPELCFTVSGSGLSSSSDEVSSQLGQFLIFKGVFQLFILIFSEPIGARAPTFSTDSNSFSYIRSVGQGFALLCQAQAYPVPLIRSETIPHSGSFI